MQLRSYQHTCLTRMKGNFDHGVEKLLNVLATGCGKTVIAAQVPQWFPCKQNFFIVHTDELAQQAARKFAHINPELRLGVEMGTLYAANQCDIVIASVQTLGRAGSHRIEAFNPALLGSLQIDEAHHAITDGYHRIIEYFGFSGLGGSTGRLLVGYTATPGRSDGVGLARVFDKISYSYSLLEAIRDGWLVNLRGVRVRTGVNLDDVHTSAGDFQQDELALAVNTEGRNRVVVEEWLKNAERRKTLGFTVGIKHAKDLAACFFGQGVRAAAVWGIDPDRQQKLLDHRAGDIAVLLNDSVLTEGYDDPTVQCILLAAPTKSQLRYIQRVGRGTRIPEDIRNMNEALTLGQRISKPDCFVLDFTDASTRHSLASLPSIFGLPKDLNPKGMPISELIDLVEQLREQHPGVDLSGLEDIDSAQTYIERVDLFEVRYPPEVEENSKYQWHRTSTGDYMLLLPARERVTISEDLLGQYKIKGIVNGSEFEDTEKDLPSAFGTADNMLRYLGRNLMAYVRRETSKKGKEPMTPRQKRALSFHFYRQSKTMPDLDGMTVHQASQLLRKFDAA